jgi:hypothetical protein
LSQILEDGRKNGLSDEEINKK